MSNLVEVKKENNYLDAFNEDSIKTQNGEDTNIKMPKEEMDIELFKMLTEKAKELASMKRSVSVVQKYYEITTSLEQLLKDCEKQKPENRDAYYNMNLSNTMVRGFLLGCETQDVYVNETDKMTGELKSKKRTQHITKIINEQGVFVNFGVQLYNTTKKLPKGTAIEIQLLKEESVKNSEGSVKVYDIFLLENVEITEKQGN